MTKIYGYLVGAGLTLTLVIGAYWYWHHAVYQSGYDSGYAKGDTDHKALVKERDDALAEKTGAEASASLWQGTLSKLQAQIEADKLAADAQRIAGERALAQARADQVKAEQSRAAWQSKYDAALKTPDCVAQRQMKLCSALQSY